VTASVEPGTEAPTRVLAGPTDRRAGRRWIRRPQPGDGGTGQDRRTGEGLAEKPAGER